MACAGARDAAVNQAQGIKQKEKKLHLQPKHTPHQRPTLRPAQHAVCNTLLISLVTPPEVGEAKHLHSQVLLYHTVGKQANVYVI
jgi:hypothetical protein